MMKRTLLALGIAAVAASGCTTNPQTNRNIECGAGVLGGAAVGGILGNQVGGGTGQRVATAVGAGAGAAAGTRLPACR
jgi:outer membrane lipoprotein SlyB